MEQTANKKTKKNNNGTLKIQAIVGKTENQRKFLKNYKQFQVISLSGYAGTGKSFLSLGVALQEVERGDFQKVMIIRSAVSSRDMGFMPGTKKEKMALYEGPYMSICSKLYGRGDAYNILKQKGIIEFESSSFLRGETFDNMVVIVDEAQNLSWQEIYTILTRIGENCKVIICGDTRQDDLTSERYKEKSGYDMMIRKLDLMSDEYFYSIEFDLDDIVRSGFVKELIRITSI